MSKERVREITEFIFEAIGEASMCWDETPKGVFDFLKKFEQMGKD